MCVNASFLGKRVVDGFKSDHNLCACLTYMYGVSSLILTPFYMHSLTQYGMTALALATDQGHDDCVVLLQQVRV